MKFLKSQVLCLLLLTTVSCSQVGREIANEVAPTVAKKGADQISGSSDALAAGIKSFIKQAGKEEGAVYIDQALDAGTGVDSDTLLQVILNGMVEEAKLTGEYLTEQQLKDAAYSTATALIAEYQLEEEGPAAAE
jgi:hypothetical protein